MLPLCILLAVFVSCEKKSAEETVQPGAASLQITVRPSSPSDEKDISHYSPEDGHICVLFGYGFNDDKFLEDFVARLQERYGLADEGGIIKPVIFNEGGEAGGIYTSISKISSFYDIVNETDNIKGLILLGAPDGTHRYLAKLRQDWDGNLPYAIFSLMPQDDVLGEEYNCDFVLEYERSASIEEEVEVKTIDKTAEQIVLRAVRYMEDLPSPLPADLDLHTHVQSIVGEKKVRRYIDGETGIQSINHFVIEQDTL